ncbi:hypothetical protein WR25_26288 [Diploscapter pachys]|uniref:Uncharacterized protein n=1 Tax=Diploscapter pachys TaxID=2018661 RepID=A0A2A2JZ75_9BILA|nr:hypothetical protein WR25_26288 [Diploscapter pachys]
MSAVIFKINHQLQLCDDCIPSSARRPIFRVTNFSADQPAKRLIFNFVHYSSPKSCFFCLDGGTRYKDRGADRATVREGQKSLDDESAATNGFRGPSAGQRTVFVYHSLIDSLHDFGEGLCRDLLNEAFIFPVQKRKSNHFEGNLSAFHLFLRRLHLPADLRLPNEIQQCNGYTREQEIIFHTPDIVRRFGPLPDYSTFGFEALYHHLLSNFKSTITNSFLKIAGTRFCLWKAVLNELLIRFENEPTADLRSYIATLPHWKNFVNNNWTVFGGKINNDTKAALPDKVRKGMSASRDRPILVPKKQFSSSERDGPRNKMPKIDDNDQPFTSTLLRPIPSPIPVIQQVLLKNQADSGLQLEDLIEDDSGHTVSPLIERLQRAPKTNDSTGSKQERKRRKTKNGEMTKLDPFKLACEFLLNENFEQVPFENVKGRFIDKMRGSSSVCIDSIVARALKATDVEHAEFLMLLAGALMILSGKIEETEHKQKSRKDKAKPNENKFFLTQFVDEKAVKQLGPLPTQIHLYSTLEANIGTAALAQGLPASTSLTAIISKFTKTILHEVIKPLDDAPFLTCSDSNKKYIQLHPDFLQAITEVVEASTHMVEILHDDDEYRKQHGLIYDSVCKQTATFL